MNIKACLSSDKNYWETPTDFYNELNSKYNFTLDPCSSETNHKCEKYYTKEDNGLEKSWEGEIVFCNPPYGRYDTGKWVEKCHEESKHSVIVLLIPARTDTAWFHTHIYGKHEIQFIKGRLKFELNGEPMKDDKGRLQSAPFPSMLVIMKPEDHSVFNEEDL